MLLLVLDSSRRTHTLANSLKWVTMTRSRLQPDQKQHFLVLCISASSCAWSALVSALRFFFILSLLMTRDCCNEEVIFTKGHTKESLFENPLYLSFIYLFYNIDQYCKKTQCYSWVTSNMLQSYFKPYECPNTAVTKSWEQIQSH